jgi:hypothetical protein
MERTPFFPIWRPRLAPMGCRTAKIVAQVRSYTLCQLEVCLASWIPQELFPKAPDKSNCHRRSGTGTKRAV